MGDLTLTEHVLDIASMGEAELQAALQNDAPADQRQSMAVRLLELTLATRDAERSQFLADLMDRDDDVEIALEARLNAALHDQPDAVYAFIRTHLVVNCDACWIPRLQQAALASLRVALEHGDDATMINWLTLIAREPAHYELSGVLHQMILEARHRAYHNPELARALVSLAAKRDPANLDTLLGDEALMAALPNNIGAVLRDFDGDPLSLLQQKGVELFMVGMARAAVACASSMFTPPSIAAIWEVYVGGRSIGTLPPHYQAEQIIQVWMERGVRCLQLEALETLAVQMLTARRDDLFLRLLHQDNGAKLLLPRLIPMLERSQRTITDAQTLIQQMLKAGDMQPQQMADAYIMMLDGLNWREDALELVEHLVWTLQKYPGIQVSAEVLWRLVNIAGEQRDEAMAKGLVKRFFTALEAVQDETQLADQLRQLTAAIQWSDAVTEELEDWWRDFVREQPIARLSRLDKTLEGKRSLEDEQDALRTISAVRRMLGGRTLRDFADQVESAFTVLEALAESFDPNSKRGVHFDGAAARAELDTHGEELSPQERQVLANNLKELAHLVAAMGDNRTRANLIRRSDDLDRDLMNGEEDPHSAVDAMKWLSGYWGGTHPAEDDEDEE